MTFSTDKSNVLDAFDRWKEKETSRLSEELRFVQDVYASIPGIGQAFETVKNVVKDKVETAIEET